MAFKLESEANDFLDKYGDSLFKQYSELNLLAVVNIGNDKFKIKANIVIPKLEKITNEKEFNLNFIDNFSIRVSKYFSDTFSDPFSDTFIVEEGSTFVAGNGTKGIPGNKIKNKNRFDYGILGLNFKIKNTNDYFLMSCEHVLSKVPKSKEMIVQKIKNENKDIAKYSFGDIFDDADVAIAKYIDKPSFNKKTIHFSENIGCELNVNNRNYKVISRKASVKVTGYLYPKKGKILKDQILLPYVLTKGDSGTIFLNSDKTLIEGMFIAISEDKKYNIVNNIQNAFKKILKYEEFKNLNVDEILIFNQF